MKVATVCDSSVPRSMMRRHSGIISVCRRKEMTSVSSIFTSAPITPSEVSLRYSKDLPLLTVFKKGYKNSGMCAFRNSFLVSRCDATHWRRASTLHALFEVLESRSGGESSGYTDTISWRSAAIVPTECQMKGAGSEKCSLYLLSSSNALSRSSEYLSSSMYLMMSSLSCSDTRVLFMKLPEETL